MKSNNSFPAPTDSFLWGQTSKDATCSGPHPPPVVYCFQWRQLAIDNRACFDTAGFTPKAAFSSENCELNAALCRNGSGVFLAPKDYFLRTLAPERTCSKKPDNPLLYFPVRLLGFVPQISLSCGRNQKLGEPQQTLVSVFRDLFSEEDAATHSA